MATATKRVSDEVQPLSSAELLDASQPVREFLMLAGKDGTGKSSAIISLARYVQLTDPDCTFNLIDTENKVRSTLRSFGSDAPGNIRYWKCDTMNQVTETTATILANYKAGDWLAVESMARIWERAQDLAYNATEGVSKVEYLERRGKKGSPIPQPDKFWNIAKGAHDSAFFDLLSSLDDLNCIFTTTVAKPPKEGGFMKESVDRKAIRIELGIDVGLEGAPRLPYYVESLALLDLKAGNVTCRILRDNLSSKEDSRVEFPVPDKKSWAFAFYENCRG